MSDNKKYIFYALLVLTPVAYFYSEFRNEESVSPDNRAVTEKTINQKLAWAYESKAKQLSDLDTMILLRWGKLGQEWNLASAPIIRDFLDQGVTANGFLATSNKQLREMSAVLYKMDTDSALIGDPDIKNKLASMAGHHKYGISLYRELHAAVLSTDEEEQKRIMGMLQAWGQKKRDMSLPTVKRISQVIPDSTFDETVKRMQKEVAEKLREEK
ncbi:MAG: hypothetical protein HOL08_13980 [Opitutae bacterium]|nr:hypothetical protein [Opitutae bacterium]